MEKSSSNGANGGANGADVDLNQRLLPSQSSSPNSIDVAEPKQQLGLGRRVWTETKKLWHILGPAIFSRVALYTMNVVNQVFAGRLGDDDLAAVSIASTVIVGFNFGLLLGMASALETLCGQAFGAKRYHMLGIYMQRSFVVLFLCCFLLLPFYVFAAPILRLLGQSDEVAELTQVVARWMIPTHFTFAFIFPLNRFLQSQRKTAIVAWLSLVGLGLNLATSWLSIYLFDFGVIGLAISLDLSWLVMAVGMFVYASCGSCTLTWTGWSVEAFSGLWEFLKLSAASGVMLCLENWYYRILILMTGFLKNTTVAVDALSICMSINGWETMIPLAFFAATGVRVANELGAGNGKAANVDVVEEVGRLSHLLGITILLNSVKPILSGVAVGSGWQAYVAYINLGCYYGVGLPLGFLMGWVFNLSVMGIWGGMIFGGTAVQTAILAVITVRCDWEKQAKTAQLRVSKWSTPNPDDCEQNTY